MGGFIITTGHRYTCRYNVSDPDPFENLFEKKFLKKGIEQKSVIKDTHDPYS